MKYLPQSRLLVLFAILASGCTGTTTQTTPEDTQGAESTQNGEGGESDDAPAAPELELLLQTGPIKGTIIEDTRVFYGIPYAANPSGDGRFSRPEPAAAWTQQLDVTSPAPACAQPVLGAPTMMQTLEEDCLHVDVWAPTTLPSEPLPVMVWFHGGGFSYGKTDNYPGHILVENDVVVIMLSYRLGPLGFLTYPDTDTEAGFAGNAAIHDQHLALQWVRDNAAVFGGDPNNVTLFGQSAGATSICQHLVSSESKGLFHKVIMQSGACDSLVMSYEESLEQGLAMARAVGCADQEDVIQCLRTVPAEELVLARPTDEDVAAGRRRFNWGPVAGAAPLADLPSSLLQTSALNKVPVLLGTNEDDGVFFAFVRGIIGLSEDEYQDALMGESPGSDAAELLELYPMENPDIPALGIANLLGDKLFNCPMAIDSRTLDSQGIDVYRYYFTQPIESGFLAELGTIHGAEMPFVFGAAVEDSYFLGEKDAGLSNQVVRYWTQFARTGNPNGSGDFQWQPFTRDAEYYLDLRDDLENKTDLRKDYCSFWDEQTTR